MKRFLAVFLFVLLILPVLLVPCFAVSDDIVSEFRADFSQIYNGVVLYHSDVALVSGWYKFEVYYPVIDMNLLSQSVFVSFVPFESGFAASFNLPFSTADGSYVDLPVSVLTGNGTIFSVPVLLDAAAYSGSYVSLESVQSDVVSDLASVGTAVLSWISGIIAVIVERPLLLFTVGIFFVGGCIAIFSRFLSRD